MVTKKYWRFKNRITKWLTKDNIKEFTERSQKFSRRWYDKTYIIKSNGKQSNTRYAVFVRQENKLRRLEDIPFKMNFGDLLLKALQVKREGISILSTIQKYL